jgi:anti-sigma factor RsiW
VGVHDQLGGQAAAYALGALAPGEWQMFEAHLATCAVCAAEVRSFATVTAALARFAAPAGPDADVRARLLRLLPAQRASSSR